jgi:hypothetical protein
MSLPLKLIFMKQYKISNFKKGWIIGDFEPTLEKTGFFELAVKFYEVGDREEKHFHKLADEITVVASGKFRMGKAILEKGDIVRINAGEAVDFECLEQGATAVVKMPSVCDDKYLG